MAGVPVAVVIKAAGRFEDAGELFQIVAAVDDAGVEEGGGTTDGGWQTSDFCFPSWRLGGWFRF